MDYKSIDDCKHKKLTKDEEEAKDIFDSTYLIKRCLRCGVMVIQIIK